VINEEIQLPDGTVLDLVIDDEGDDLDEHQRRALEKGISNSLRQAANGEVAPAAEILARLHSRRG
jgi:hypothetical protein